MAAYFERAMGWVALTAMLLAVSACAQSAGGSGPYGSCTPQMYERLRIDVDGKCKGGPMRCSQQIGCEACRVSFLTNEPCIMAQQLLLTMCFNGQNEELKKRLKEHDDAQRVCYDLLESRKCEPEEVPIPLSEEELAKDDVPFTGKVKPPGDCSKVEYRQLQSEVGFRCKDPSNKMRCDPNDKQLDCINLRRNLARFDACISAREHVMNKCFRGGDEKHIKKLEENKGGRATCAALIEQHCRPIGPCKACTDQSR